jgi:hypothetical protein
MATPPRLTHVCESISFFSRSSRRWHRCAEPATRARCHRRERAASLRPRRVARSALLQRTRARGAGMGRRVDLDRRASCLGRAVRTDTPAVQRTRTRRSHASGGDHQRLEPHCHQFSFRSRLVPAAGARVRWRACVLRGGRTNAQSVRFQGRDPFMPIEGITDLSSLRSCAA